MDNGFMLWNFTTQTHFHENMPSIMWSVLHVIESLIMLTLILFNTLSKRYRMGHFMLSHLLYYY